MKKSLLVLLLVLAAVAVAAGGYYKYGRNVEPPKVATIAVSRGDIAETVGATGTIEAVTTVQVGTQVSGTIQALYADFNSIVRRGQLIAELDPSILETQVAQGRANLVRAQADVERLRVSLEAARNKLKRTRDLSARNLVPAMELETAETQVNSILAQQRSAEAQVVLWQGAGVFERCGRGRECSNAGHRWHLRGGHHRREASNVGYRLKTASAMVFVEGCVGLAATLILAGAWPLV